MCFLEHAPIIEKLPFAKQMKIVSASISYMLQLISGVPIFEYRHTHVQNVRLYSTLK